MDDRLQALLDKQEITELIHAYCNAADRHDHDKLRTLYHDCLLLLQKWVAQVKYFSVKELTEPFCQVL